MRKSDENQHSPNRVPEGSDNSRAGTEVSPLVLSNRLWTKIKDHHENCPCSILCVGWGMMNLRRQHDCIGGAELELSIRSMDGSENGGSFA